jgi:hypothetical protein
MILHYCNKCNEPYGYERNAIRCCSALAKIDTETIAPIEKREKQTPEEKKIARDIYYQNNKEKILLKQRCYDKMIKNKKLKL